LLLIFASEALVNKLDADVGSAETVASSRHVGSSLSTVAFAVGVLVPSELYLFLVDGQLTKNRARESEQGKNVGELHCDEEMRLWMT
jgi:hypothetical protein